MSLTAVARSLFWGRPRPPEQVLQSRRQGGSLCNSHRQLSAPRALDHAGQHQGRLPAALRHHPCRHEVLGQRAELVLPRSGIRCFSPLQRSDAGRGVCLASLGYLSSTFGNSAPKTKTLVNRLDRGVYAVSQRPKSSAPKDDRGPVVRTVETAHTFLTASEVDALVGDYLAGMSVKALAERYGIHRATVFAHLRRRNVPSRRPGLGIDEKAEAVRLARAGVSMRAIGRRMGVDRKAVRAALVEAGLIADESASSS